MTVYRPWLASTECCQSVLLSPVLAEALCGKVPLFWALVISRASESYNASEPAQELREMYAAPGVIATAGPAAADCRKGNTVLQGAPAALFPRS